jgi:hypothetical protein
MSSDISDLHYLDNCVGHPPHRNVGGAPFFEMAMITIILSGYLAKIRPLRHDGTALLNIFNQKLQAGENVLGEPLYLFGRLVGKYNLP